MREIGRWRLAWTRRELLEALAAGAVVLSVPACRPRKKAGSASWVERLPPDRRSVLQTTLERILPGATEAGALEFVDSWLSRPPFDGLQHQFELATLVLNREAARQFGKPFFECEPAQCDQVLERFLAGTAHPRFDAERFWKTLVTLTVESFLGDPKYGGNRNEVGWRLIGWEPCWYAPKHLADLVSRDPDLPY